VKYNCQICGSDKNKTIHSEIFDNNKFEYAICKRCSFVFQINCHDKQKYLNLPYQTQTNYEEHSKNRAKYIYEFSKEYLDYDIDVFDVGCSKGGVMKYFKELLPDITLSGCTVLGRDEKVVSNSLDIINNDFDDIIFNKKYDFIIMSHILEHFVDLRKTLRKLKTIMKESSKIYIEVPYLDYLKVRLSFELCPEHISYFTPHSLKNLLLSEGYDILKIKDSKYWGNIKVLITKRFKEKHIFAKRKSYILYIIEKSFRKCTHWFYRFKLKYFNINSND
jgi:hypothetical protein